MYRHISTQTSESTKKDKRDFSYNSKPLWKLKQDRKQFRKKIFGEHYNYNYKKPNQHKKFRIEETRNTEIERENRILLQKIQTIFKRSLKRESRINTTAMVKEEYYEKSQEQNEEQYQNSHKKVSAAQLGLSKMKRFKTQVKNKSYDNLKNHVKVKYDNKIVLYKGKKRCNEQKSYDFVIFVDQYWYKIMAETQNTHQIIQMPYEDYKQLFKGYLKEDHCQIFKFLKVNKTNNLLQFKGLNRKFMDVIQYGQVTIGPQTIPLIQRIKKQQSQEQEQVQNNNKNAIRKPKTQDLTNHQEQEKQISESRKVFENTDNEGNLESQHVNSFDENDEYLSKKPNTVHKYTQN